VLRASDVKPSTAQLSAEVNKHTTYVQDGSENPSGLHDKPVPLQHLSPPVSRHPSSSKSAEGENCVLFYFNWKTPIGMLRSDDLTIMVLFSFLSFFLAADSTVTPFLCISEAKTKPFTF